MTVLGTVSGHAIAPPLGNIHRLVKLRIGFLMNSKKHIKKQRQLINAYEQLDSGMKKIVQVASGSDDPMPRTNLIGFAAKVGVTHEDGRTPSYKEDRDALNDVIDQGLLEYVSKSKSGPVQVAILLDDYVFRQAFHDGVAKATIDADGDQSRNQRFAYPSYDENTVIRNLRMAFYGNDWKTWQELTSRYKFRPYVLDPFCLETFRQLKPALQADVFERAVENLVNFGDCRRSEIAIQAFDIVNGMKQLPEAMIVAAIDLFAARGDVAGLQMLAQRVDAPRSEIQGCIEFLQGDYENARKQFDTAISETKKRTKKRRIELRHIPSIFYGLLLLKENSLPSQKQLKQVAEVISDWTNGYRMAAAPLSYAFSLQIAPMQNKVQPRFDPEAMSPLGFLLTGLNWCWFYADQKPAFERKQLEQFMESYQSCEMNWLAAEFSAILSRITSSSKQNKHLSFADNTHALLKTNSLVDFIKPLAPWESALTALENLCEGPNTSAAQSPSDNLSDERLIWELKYSDGGSRIDLTPFIQKLGKKGWSKGRKVGLSRLYDQWQSSNFDFLTDQDRAICKWLNEQVERNYYGYRETYYDWNQDRIGKAIVGHPHVYLPNHREEPLQITESRPHLTIKQTKKQIKLAVQPKYDGESQYVQKQGSHRLSIVQFSESQKKVAELIANLPAIPREQADRVAAIARSISSVIDVQSDIEGAQSSGEEVVASSRIVVQLTPYQDGLRAELFVQPLGEHGPFCRSGIGARSVFANVEGKPLTTTRDLKAERKNLQQLLTECHPLDTRTINDEQTEWLFHDSDDALELVMELQTLAEQDKLSVLWPRGKSHEVAGNVTDSSFRITVKRDRDWFAASGDLKVDDELTLDLMKLLDLVSDSPSRFVKLDDGRFLALTKELRQRIADITAYGTTMKNNVRFDPVRALVVDELLENTNFKVDKHWKSHIARIEEASTISVDPPSTLQAELRDYQAEGYAWLKRMTHWNTGACLADDMGLGKTIQALALLIDRSSDGPMLVVAPASIGFNWESETRKFAPTLVPKLFRDCDRDQFFQDIQPGDLVITSYGLLQSEIERFEEVHWATILLDEAQAIKNMATKRSQAVMQLQGDFKLILTGTPMENHLGELWNLFRFIVPGLLGSNDDFRKRYAIAIERDNCRQTQNRLKKLIQPFLLRRTKAEVLSELPPCSESVLEIELSSDEIALYESLRRKAIERIEEAAIDPKSPGQQHLKVLAELTRLRLACCHPVLVGGEGIESTKLDLFRQKVSEIIEGKHKVLVFSQFVKHLEILRNELDAMGISYQYLDGSTSMKKRKLAVEKFQAGEGDVFLISLKAGGTGLNLTAADYVIHMDPWWNPAVEDQATGRAHRIGQQRPVNVYRFITKGTIEEKILDLHNTKRDLADNLLAGSDSAGQLSTKDLINLLKDNQLVEVAT